MALLLNSLADIINHTRWLLDEITPAKWTDFGVNAGVAELDGYINAEYLLLISRIIEAAEDYYLKKDITNLTITSGTLEYTVPTDFIASRRVEIVDPNDDKVRRLVWPIGLNDQYMTTGDDIIFGWWWSTWGSIYGGTRWRYYLQANQIILDPEPDSSIDNFLIHLWYIHLPTTMAAGTDPPDFPINFRELIALGAAIRALAKDKGATARFQVLYDPQYQLMMRSIENRKAQTVRRVRQISEVGDTM